MRMCETVLHVVYELSKAETENILVWEHTKVTVSLSALAVEKGRYKR